MKKHLILLCCLIGLTSMNAQRTMITATNTGLISTNNKLQYKARKGPVSYEEAMAEYQDIDGTPFLFKGDLNVELYNYKDSVLKDVILLYDLYNIEILARKKGEASIILDPVFYTAFTFEQHGKSYTYKKLNPEKPQKFVQLLYENEDFSFFSDLDIRLTSSTRHVPGQITKSKRFDHVKYYYIATGEKVTKVKLSKTKMLKDLPPPYAEKIRAKMKALKIKKLKKADDYIEILNLL